MELKEYRKSIGISIQEAALITSVPVRTYIRYENSNDYGNVLKRKAILNSLKEKYEVTETKGILSVETIRNKVTEVLKEYKEQVEFCYLFGSYAKGYAKENSDVDLCISTSLKGFDFVGLIEELKTALKKNVDLLRLSDMKDNIELVNEIMKDGVKIYG